jgi:hypothetical protein
VDSDGHSVVHLPSYKRLMKVSPLYRTSTSEEVTAKASEKDERDTTNLCLRDRRRSYPLLKLMYFCHSTSVISLQSRA